MESGGCVARSSWGWHRCERTRSAAGGFHLREETKGKLPRRGFCLGRCCSFQLGCGPLGPSSTPKASWEGGGIHQTSNKWSWVRTSHSPHIHNCGAHRSWWELRTSRCDLRWHFQPSPEMGGHQLYLFIPSSRLPIWCEQLCLAARFCLATSRLNLMKWVVFWWPEGKKHINLETIKAVWHVLL